MKRPDLARKQRQHHSKLKSQAASGDRRAESPETRRERLQAIRAGTGAGPRLKRCSVCGLKKPLSDFGRDRQGRYGRKSACRSCVLDLVRAMRSHVER